MLQYKHISEGEAPHQWHSPRRCARRVCIGEPTPLPTQRGEGSTLVSIFRISHTCRFSSWNTVVLLYWSCIIQYHVMMNDEAIDWYSNIRMHGRMDVFPCESCQDGLGCVACMHRKRKVHLLHRLWLVMFELAAYIFNTMQTWCNPLSLWNILRTLFE